MVFIQVCGCADEQSQLNCIVSLLRVLVDTAAEAAWVSDVLIHRHDVSRLLQHLINDCSTTEMNVHDRKLLTALISDSQKILTLMTS